MHETTILSDIGSAIVAATVLALIARWLRQPLILAYLLAGVAVGPELGFGLVRDRETIALISEVGLILLLFIIGLEMDLQKLLGAGRPLRPDRPPPGPALRAARDRAGGRRGLRPRPRTFRRRLRRRVPGPLQHDDRGQAPLRQARAHDPPRAGDPGHPRVPGRLGHPRPRRAALPHEPVPPHPRDLARQGRAAGGREPAGQPPPAAPRVLLHRQGAGADAGDGPGLVLPGQRGQPPGWASPGRWAPSWPGWASPPSPTTST